VDQVDPTCNTYASVGERVSLSASVSEDENDGYVNDYEDHVSFMHC